MTIYSTGSPESLGWKPGQGRVAASDQKWRSSPRGSREKRRGRECSLSDYPLCAGGFTFSTSFHLHNDPMKWANWDPATRRKVRGHLQEPQFGVLLPAVRAGTLTKGQGKEPPCPPNPDVNVHQIPRRLPGTGGYGDSTAASCRGHSQVGETSPPWGRPLAPVVNPAGTGQVDNPTQRHVSKAWAGH